MAMQAKVPEIPVFLEGLEAIMPRGITTPRPGPVNVRMGAPISLEGIESVPEGTAKLEHAMRELGGSTSNQRPPTDHAMQTAALPTNCRDALP